VGVRRLRSRWTVVALVPACFLASFGLVTALAGGDQEAVPVAADARTESSGASPAPAVPEVSQTTTPEGAPGTDTATTGAEGQTTDTTGGDGTTIVGADGNGTGNGAPAPPPGTIAVDYGRWKGMFEISGTEIVPDFGLATVTGEFRYLGGATCSQVGVVELRGRFYSPAGRPIGSGLWESIWVTGNGAEVPQREPLYLEFYGSVTEEAGSARIRFTRVDCL
jgi:hypothetical protein